MWKYKNQTLISVIGLAIGFTCFALAAPVALFAINRYLENFANKAPVSWWFFAIAMTLFYQTQKAATRNPAEEINN